MGDIQRWHDFFMLTGTAAATLIGLIFVAISFAVNSKAERTRHDMNAYVTPSLVYFAEVFVIAGASVAPIPVGILAKLMIGLLLFNLPFGLWRLRYLSAQHKEEAIPRTVWTWQVALPAIAQLILGAGGYGLLIADERALAAVALSVTLLLLVGIRNAWMLVVWLLEQR
jgi:hypothetical protein